MDTKVFIDEAEAKTFKIHKKSKTQTGQLWIHSDIVDPNFLKLFKSTDDESFPIIRVKIEYSRPWPHDWLESSIKLKNFIHYNIQLRTL